jgi:ketosteroid isomerase-like protein
VVREQEVYVAYVHAIESEDLDALSGCYADDCQTTSSTWQRTGRDAVLDGWRSWFEDFTEIKLGLNSLIACDSTLVAEWTELATLRRTGRSYSVRGASVHRFRDDKIVSDYIYVDRLLIRQQLEGPAIEEQSPITGDCSATRQQTR